MADSRSDVVYLSFDQACAINRSMIDKSGGSFFPPQNLLNPSALEYILASIIEPDLKVFDHLVLKNKAAKLAFHIISRHVFYDGNKRTAIYMAWEFLYANGISVNIESSIIDLSLSIAQGNSAEIDLITWLKEHQAQFS